jgi:hypothetical protein
LAPRPAADGQQSESLTGNPTEDRRHESWHDRESYERQLIRPTEFPPLARPGSPDN